MELIHITFLSSIVSILLIHQCSHLVQADEALVSSVCSKTEQPGYCNQCINSYPTQKNGTVKDLAGTLIDCTINESTVVHDSLDHYNRTTHLKEIIQCEVIYNGVKETLGSARDSLDRDRYENARLYLDAAESLHLTCFDLLLKVKRYIPGDLATAFYAFRAYDAVAKNIVGQVKKS